MASLSVSLDRFEGSVGILRFPDGQELAVDRALLPAEAAEGASVAVSFGAEGGEAERLGQARQLLTDILQGS